MSGVISSLNTKYNEMIEELFEEVLCDKCRKTVKIGNIQGKLVNTLNNQELLLCKDCNDKLIQNIKKC